VKVALLLSAPETPCAVIGKLPTVAVLLAVNVAWLVPAVLGAPNAAVTPLGNPDADRLTLLLKPFCGMIVTAPAAVDPRGSPRAAPVNDSVKFGAVIVSPMVVELVSAPETPVTVTVYVPAAAALFALNVSPLLLVVLAGLKAAVTPLGMPDTARATLPLNPFWPATLMVLVPLLPRGTVRLLAEDDRVKLGTTTVSAIAVVLLRLPETPVTVSG
jgi:hypothetical protein